MVSSRKALGFATATLVVAITIVIRLLGLQVATSMAIFALFFFFAAYLYEKIPDRNRAKEGAWALFLPASALAVLGSWPFLFFFNLTLSEKRVSLYLKYAYEWNYKDATQLDYIRKIDIPIRRKYASEEMRLDLGIYNENARFSIDEVWLIVLFINKGLKIRPDGKWQCEPPNVRCFHKLGSISRKTPMGTDGALFIKFPAQGEYQVIYLINSRDLDRIKRKFTMILY